MDWKRFGQTGLLYLKTRDWSDLGVRLGEKGFFWGSLFVVIFYWDTLSATVSTGWTYATPYLPIIVPIVTASVILWGAIVMNVNTDDNWTPPSVLHIFGPLGMMYCVSLWIPTSGTWTTIVLAIPVGIIVWTISMVVVGAIVMSILGIDPQQSRYERRKKQSGDPYGDPHAARILEDEN